MSSLTHGSLFSGIGGFDLAARWMGWENVFNVEIDPFCRKVLNYHFPKSESFTDVRKFESTNFYGRVQVLSGGFPCQPFSTAGKRKGTQDDRYMWPEMLRVIQEVRPSWIVAENVRGLLNWSNGDGRGGVVLDTVCNDLENEGYEVCPLLLSSANVNAPHKRERVWVVAHSYSNGEGRKSERNEGESDKERVQEWDEIQQPKKPNNLREFSTQMDYGRGFKDFPSFAAICRPNDGIPRELDNITFSKWRTESNKAYGNAITPQVAYQIFRAIQLTEKQLNQ